MQLNVYLHDDCKKHIDLKDVYVATKVTLGLFIAFCPEARNIYHGIYSSQMFSIPKKCKK